MPTVDRDRFHGTARLDRSGWARKAERLFIRGLSGVLTADPVVVEAHRAMRDAGYTYGAAHPSIPDLYMLGEYEIEAHGDDSATVDLEYRRKERIEDDPTSIEVEGSESLVQEQTNQDADGEDIVVSRKPSADRAEKVQPVTVDVWRPVQTLRFRKVLETNPAPYARELIGRTNADTFQGDPPGLWLLKSFTFRSNDGGQSWDTSVELSRMPGGWKETVYYVMDGGRPPENFDAAYNDGLTVRTYEVYETGDFSVLGHPDVMG
jgi:hypothetical protein